MNISNTFTRIIIQKLFLLFIVTILSITSLFAQLPTISTFSPASGPVGTSVDITGTNFGATMTDNIVFFGATKATVTNITATTLTVTVPAGATYQRISVLNTTSHLFAYSAKPFLTTFTPTKSYINPGDIAAKVDFATGTNPNSVAIGDIDGDGKADLVVVNKNDNTISIFHNTSTSSVAFTASSFATMVDFATGSSPTSVAIGDIDGDGKPDLAVTNGASATVSIFRNISTSGPITTGSFEARVDFATGTTPNSVAIGDIDDDGKPDLAVANSGSNNVSILRNTSTSGATFTGTSFASTVNFIAGTTPNSVAIGDIDGNGVPDLAVTNGSSNNVSVLRNTSTSGSITFAGAINLTTGTTPNSIAIGDLDGDGKSDLAVTNGGTFTVSVLRNTSPIASITFATKVDLTVGTGAVGAAPFSVAINDIDGDGKSDLAVANSGSTTVSVLRNISTSGSIVAGSFVAKVDFTTGTTPNSIAIGDLDGDGKPDFAITNAGSSTVSVLRNTPLFPPTITSFSQTSGVVGTSITITGTYFDTTAANNIVFFGATKATVTAATATTLTVTVPVGATYRPISVLNVTTSLFGYSATPFVTIFKPTKNSIATTDFATKVDFTTLTTPVSVTIGDLDGDGKPDLAVADFGSLRVSVFLNTSTSGSITTGSFATRVDLTTPTQPTNIAIGDLDGDGKPDLAVACANSSKVSILRNTSTIGSISFATSVDFTTGTSASSVAIGDLDGDGKPDLAVSNKTSNTVSIFRNTSTSGSIAFTGKVDFTTGTSPNSLAISDLDGDGKPDIAVANSGSASVSVFRNTSTSGVAFTAASFATAVNLTTATTPNYVAIGDLDGDGKPDLATANTNGTNPSVSVLRNTSTSGSITFVAKVDFTTGGTPYYIAIGDLDGDGKQDLAIANRGTTTTSVLRNTSTIGTTTFVAKVDFTTGPTSTSVAIGDIDGDGKPDLVATDYNTFAPISNSVSILRNAPIYTPSINITFTNTATASWTNGNGTSRAVFVAAASTGSPLPVDNTTYAANPAFGTSGTQIGTTGWYCVYNGTGNTVNITSLAPGTSYRVMVVDYYGTAGTESYLTTTATGNPANLPVVSTSGSLAALSTTYGTPSSSSTFNVSGTDMTAGILVTAPTGFEVSLNNATGYATSITVGGAGTIASTTVYIRLNSATPVGSYAGNVILSSSGAVSSNVATVSSIISQAALTITAATANKTYGTAITGGAGSTAFTPVGLQNSETIGSVTIAYGTGSAATAAVGTYTSSVTPSLAVDGTFTASNYNITYSTGDIVVAQAALTITATGPSKTYGTALTAVTSTTDFTAGTTVNSETVTGLTLTPDAAGLSATTAAAAAYVVTPSLATGTNGFLASNYNITYVPFNGTVATASLTITATGPSKTYGTALTAGTSTTNFTAGATPNGETVTGLTLTPDAAGLSATTAAGAAYVVTPSLATGTNGFLESNYTITYLPFNGTVATAALIITASNATKVYSTANPTLGVTYAGFVNGDDNTSLTTQPGITTTAVTGSPVGTYPITASGAASANYTISYTDGTLTVTQAALTITASNATKTYGTANPALSVTYAGFVNGDDNTSLTTQPSITTTAVTGSPVGTYPVTASGAASANYTISYAAGTLTVIQAALTITASNATKTYGTANPALSVTYAGFVNGDDNTSLTTQPTVTTTAVTGSAVGTYPVTASGAASANYSISYTGGTLTVTQAALTITARNTTKT
jgi:hypothetical protein